jgi:anti-sigma factor RsiW
VSADLRCRELVEVITDYLEGALPHDYRVRFEAHLAACDGCRDYLEQFEQAIALTGRVEAEQLPPGLRDELLSAFREQSL